MSNKPTIEDDPNLRSVLRNTVEWSVTSLMWTVWIYLLLPLFGLVLWIVGLPHIFRTLFAEEVIHHLLSLLRDLGWAALVIFLIIRGWGLYNYYVFGKYNRRRRHPVVSEKELSRHFGLAPEQVRSLQQRKEIIWTTLYDDMHIQGVESENYQK